MKRARIMICLRSLVVVLVLAAPALARPAVASAGFTWDDNAAASTDVTQGADGWTWDDNAAITDVTQAADGWTWDDGTTADATQPSP
jgi:hypothetical protein